MATLKHLGSKNADYGAAEQYLLFEHDEFTMKPVLDENGRLIPREDYRLSTLNCGGEDFAVACMRSNLRYEKNQRREDVKSHHYIISCRPFNSKTRDTGQSCSATNNYEAEISRFMDNVEKMKGVVLDNENDAAQKAEQKRTA